MAQTLTNIHKINMKEKTDKIDTINKPATHFDTWNEIFAEIEGSLHVPLPLRVKNWLRNKFNPPTQKSSEI